MVNEHSPQRPNSPPVQEEEDENVPLDQVEVIEIDEESMQYDEEDEEFELEEQEEQEEEFDPPEFKPPTRDDSILTFKQHSSNYFILIKHKQTNNKII